MIALVVASLTIFRPATASFPSCCSAVSGIAVCGS